MVKKILKGFLIFLLLIIVAITVTYIFISPIAKYLVERNSLKWMGRKITVGEIKVKATNGSVYIKDLKIYEANDTGVFFACHDIYLKMDLKKLLNKVYVIDKVKIDEPEISIVQNGNKFNFDDLVKHFAPGPDEKPDTTKKAAVPYYVDSVIINNGNITYNNVPIHNVFKIHNINLSLPEITWDKPEAKLHLDFKYGTGGDFNIDVDLNQKTLAYNLALSIDKYDLSQYYTPLKTVIKVSSIKGELTTKLRIHGKLKSPAGFSLAGYLHINDVEVRDAESRKTFALGEFSTTVDTINVKQNMFIFKNIIFDRPYFRFEDYPEGSNISQMIKSREKPEVPEKIDTVHKKGKVDYSNIFTALSSNIKAMAIDFLGANYHADLIAIRNGEFVFNDHTEHNFHYTVTKFNFATDEIGAKNKSVVFRASAKLDDSSKFNLKANITYDFRHKLFSYSVDTLKVSDVSPIAKYLLEKNSVKWTGRVITTGNIKLNAVKGSVYIKDIKIYEPDSTNVFFDCHDVYLRVNLKQMLNNTFQVDKIKIDNPEINIAQNGNHFNFEDMIKHFSSGPSQPADTEKSPELHYYIDSVLINHGNVNYLNVPIHTTYRITDINFKLPQVAWDNPMSKVHLDFNYGTGGFFNIDLNANRTTLDYDLALNVNNFDLSQYYAPLSTFLSISSLKGLLNADFSLHGKFNSPKNVSGTGYLSINDLVMKDTTNRKVFAMGLLTVDIDSVNVMQNMYSVNNIVMDRPYMRFDYYTKGNNISQMIKYTSATPVTDTATGQIKPDYSNIFTLLASSVKMMAVDFVNTNYHTDSIVIRNGEFEYNDFTLNAPFHYDITNLNIATNKISSKTKDLQFKISSTLADTGKLTMLADVSLDMKNMLLEYNLTGVRVSDFNPYSEYWVGTPFNDGYMDYKSVDSVINRNLKSTNFIHIVGLEVGRKTDIDPVFHLPIRMAVSLMKDGKGNIDLKIPAKGNLDDPNYKIGPLVGRIMKDLILKTAESPFRELAKIFEKGKDPEDLKQVNFDYMQAKFEAK